MLSFLNFRRWYFSEIQCTFHIWKRLRKVQLSKWHLWWVVSYRNGYCCQFSIRPFSSDLNFIFRTLFIHSFYFSTYIHACYLLFVGECVCQLSFSLKLYISKFSRLAVGKRPSSAHHKYFGLHTQWQKGEKITTKLVQFPFKKFPIIISFSLFCVLFSLAFSLTCPLKLICNPHIFDAPIHLTVLYANL